MVRAKRKGTMSYREPPPPTSIRRMTHAPSIQERVLEVLRQYEGTTFTLNQMDRDIPDLRREQINASLHGLSEHGLKGRLKRTGKGIWSYATEDMPSYAHSDAESYLLYERPPMLPAAHPVGDTFPVTVVARRRQSGGGDEYTLVSEDGAMFQATLILELEAIKPAALEDPPPRLIDYAPNRTHQ